MGGELETPGEQFQWHIRASWCTVPEAVNTDAAGYSVSSLVRIQQDLGNLFLFIFHCTEISLLGSSQNTS